MAQKLKVFRTAIGFHDAYVAAPSRKAALAAWGSDKDLFARGVAEPVTDPALSEEPLASPGAVIKRLRGTEAEQIAALPKSAPAAKRTKQTDAPPAKKAPRPSRAALDKAEEALGAADKQQAAERKALIEREAKLARERRQLEQTQRTERAKLEQDVDDASAAFDAAMHRWRS